VVAESEKMEIPDRERLSPQSAEMFQQFGSAMPLLKEMLIASRNSEARTQ